MGQLPRAKLVELFRPEAVTTLLQKAPTQASLAAVLRAAQTVPANAAGSLKLQCQSRLLAPLGGGEQEGGSTSGAPPCCTSSLSRATAAYVFTADPLRLGLCARSTVASGSCGPAFSSTECACHANTPRSACYGASVLEPLYSILNFGKL